jgi:hypothetical protein
VAALIVWFAAAPPELVLNEAIVTPLAKPAAIDGGGGTEP